MMSDVDTDELAAIGARIQEPAAATFGGRVRRGPDTAARAAAARWDLGAVRRDEQPTTADRLAELADWWATVAGTTPPRRVEQLWLARPGHGGPARAEVVIRRFDAPAAIDDAIAWGVAVADDAVDDGTDLILLSVQDDPGSDDDASWQVAAAQVLGIDAVEALGWPAATGLSDQEWIVRVTAVRDGLRTVRDSDGRAGSLLGLLASPGLAAGTGLLLQAAARRTPALLDGPAAATCALLAHQIARAGRAWWQPTDAGASVLHDRILSELRLFPLTRLGLPTEDGTAARLGLELLESAVSRAVASAAEDPEPEDDYTADAT